MGIPIVQEVWDGIRWLIDQFTDKAPRPLKVILFLFFLVAFGNIIVWFFHLGGIHCNTSKEIIKIDAFDISTNVKILWKLSKNPLTSETVTVEEANPYVKYAYLQSTLESCTLFMKNVSGKFQMCEVLNESGCFFYYRQGNCHNCSVIDVGWIYSPNTFGNWKYEGSVCDDGARYKSKSLFQSYYSCESLCEIPEHYSWNYDEGIFECADPDYCGVNATKIPDNELDFILKQSGGVLLYSGEEGELIENVFRLKCTEKLNPKLTLFGSDDYEGIDIFSYKIWLLLVVIYIMFMFLSYIKPH